MTANDHKKKSWYSSINMTIYFALKKFTSLPNLAYFTNARL